MNRRNDLLSAWDSRGELPEGQQLSADSREQVATIFLKIAKSHDGDGSQGHLTSSLKEWSASLASLARAA